MREREKESDKLTRALTSVRFESFLRFSDRSSHITGGTRSYGNADRRTSSGAGYEVQAGCLSYDVGSVFAVKTAPHASATAYI